MRKINFRAKGLKKNRWYYGDLVYQCTSNPYIITIDGEKILIDYKTKGQFTGLKDITNREIYTGDILKVENYTSGYRKGVVVWIRGEYAITQTDDYYYSLTEYYFNNKILEIIGNRYDNPELIDNES